MPPLSLVFSILLALTAMFHVVSAIYYLISGQSWEEKMEELGNIYAWLFHRIPTIIHAIVILALCYQPYRWIVVSGITMLTMYAADAIFAEKLDKTSFGQHLRRFHFPVTHALLTLAVFMA